MQTLYKNTRLFAATIVGTLFFTAGAAVAVTHPTQKNFDERSAETLGRFVVTPESSKFVPASSKETVGRFVVSQHSAVFVPAA